MHLIVFANPLENDFATSVNSLLLVVSGLLGLAGVGGRGRRR